MIILSLASCGGGLNCPIDPPACCSNVLFGCGTFDLPFGCECSQWGFGRSVPPQRLSGPITRGADLSGSWRGPLNRTTSSCAGLPRTVRGAVAVTTTGQRVTVAIPGYGNLRGTTRATGFSASGALYPFTPLCRADVNTDFTRKNATTNTVRTSLVYTCGRTRVCSAQYVGEMSR